jgi:hypothetical protein
LDDPESVDTHSRVPQRRRDLHAQRRLFLGDTSAAAMDSSTSKPAAATTRESLVRHQTASKKDSCR